MRELKVLPQRKVAAALDIDTATYCKIEKGVMFLKREYLPNLAHLFEADESDLLKQWLAEKVASFVETEGSMATEALTMAQEIVSNHR